MPGRSVSDQPAMVSPGTSGPADRWSLAISVMLIVGLLLATIAIHQHAEIVKPKPLKPVSKTIEKPPPGKHPMPKSKLPGLAIQLPPPPAPSRPTGKVAAVQPQQPVLAPRAKPVGKTRPIEPLKRRAAPIPKPIPTPVPVVKKTIQVEPLKPARPHPPKVIERRPLPKPALKTKPVQLTRKPPEKPATAATGTVVISKQNLAAGGALLRLLEHGQGPSIEIAWPRQPHLRRALYRQLTNCYGVKEAVMVGSTQLFDDTSAPGQTWSIDMDRFSGFIRSPQGEAIEPESRVFASIANRHRLAGWRPVRVFPRQVDAALLGGLGAVLGPRYKSAKQIRAAYRWDRTQLILTDFSVDGRSLDGAVSLPLPPRRTRGAGCD